jgi:cytochrome c
MKASRFAFLLGILALPAMANEDAAARKLAKDNNCFRCHAIDREKDGPSWSSIGDKYRQKPDGEAKLLTHLTSAPKIKLREQGGEEKHKIAQYRDESELTNLVRWILSL